MRTASPTAHTFIPVFAPEASRKVAEKTQRMVRRNLTGITLHVVNPAVYNAALGSALNRQLAILL